MNSGRYTTIHDWFTQTDRCFARGAINSCAPRRTLATSLAPSVFLLYAATGHCI